MSSGLPEPIVPRRVSEYSSRKLDATGYSEFWQWYKKGNKQVEKETDDDFEDYDFEDDFKDDDFDFNDDDFDFDGDFEDDDGFYGGDEDNWEH